MKLDELVAELDAYFHVGDVEGASRFEGIYPGYWEEFTEPGYEVRRNGLMIRSGSDVDRAATCVFPSDEIAAALEPGTLLFSEHPVSLEDDVVGFQPLARESFKRMKDEGISFYQVHEPLDHHAEVSPSRLLAWGLGIDEFEEYFPIAQGIPGAAAVVGQSSLSLDELVVRVRDVLGEEIPVELLTRHRQEASRVAIAAGGGADAAILQESLELGCQTFVTGNAATKCRLDFVQAGVRAFRELAEEASVSVVSATHYGTEKPPQLAMVEWFRNRGLPAEFHPGRPES